LQCIRDEQLAVDDVYKAETTDDLIRRLDTHQIALVKGQAQKEIEAQYQKRLEHARDDLASFQAEVNETRKRIRAKHRAEEAELKAKHEAEIQEFRQSWHTPQVIRKFNRASPQLQTLRRRSISLLANRRMSDLQLAESEMKDLEARERNEKYRSMSVSFDAQLGQLTEKHRREIDVVKSAKQIQEQAFLAAANTEMEHHKNRIHAIETALKAAGNADRAWNLHHRFEKRPAQMSKEPTRFSKNRGLPLIAGTARR
jgi:hypothetical protein